MISLALGVVLLALYWSFRRRDRRMLRNGVLLVSGVLLTVTGLIDLAWLALGEVPGAGEITRYTTPLALTVVAGFFLFPIGLLALVTFLLINGVTMFRREGRSLGNLLSLLAGLGLLAAPVAFVWLFISGSLAGVALALLIFFVTGYLAASFLVILVYAWVYGRSTAKVRPAAIMICGAQIIDGKVPPLLRSRLDRAIRLYHSTANAGLPAPLMIPSGGQGPDEPRPEGAAMAEYLREQGIPEEHIAVEDQAVNTEQNLLLSARVQHQAGRSGPMAAVTNNYHALRTALLARRLKLDAEAVGAKTAFYYVPSAFLREFAAVMLGHRVLHAVLFAPFLLIVVAMFTLWLLFSG
ncbi:YdcF family protein [Nesterenkonia ebinurensis]|uniref:YdcF family protein n=1 Tax=Nesterenkonia ebinurensis TaxID=2608252 RepID=UPI001CC40A95|nr:YdcF family protein [Nesterenkonia ebinurensis]